ncbi:hypothetical protein PVL30_003020 [Lodderomyces elongisporus]|uniref:uncharacterized protein n=1 Tax=Lodderomyces elongisporus TaxID=36914 RepID=UPI0029226B73|nr:uncharacterized protein PVL30_003020 [Lodderomyces elongisporus]WLF79268.1 hypothetical protein PVL30_003020 [Lodderomyces elongisporus]
MTIHNVSLFTTIFNIFKFCVLYITSSLGISLERFIKCRKVKNINDIVSEYGYRARDHVVTTKDGYLLVIHKLEKLHNVTDHHSSSGQIVYFHHGLMTNSELWVLGSSKEKFLPFLLVDLGYEVWLGNNRGNKYSKKHLKLSSASPEFWDFSLDELAYFDVPDSLKYIQDFYKYKRNGQYVDQVQEYLNRNLNQDPHGNGNGNGNGNCDNDSGGEFSEESTQSSTPLPQHLNSSSTTTLVSNSVAGHGHSRDIIYIGFSQGCSQLLASLGLYPSLNGTIKLFVGLSPAIIPKQSPNSIVRLITDQTAADNTFLYSFFGQRAILPSVPFWATIFGARLHGKIIDKAVQILFGWTGDNISQGQKMKGYPQLFSNTSVKTIVHWYQIVKSGYFQMFDETGSCGLTGLSSISADCRQKGTRVTPFPISDHLDVPMMLFFGDKDILVDVESTKSLILDSNPMMNEKLEVVKCYGYEHMDTLWGNDVYDKVFSKIIDRLESNGLSEGK